MPKDIRPFDTSQIEDFDQEKFDRCLAEHPELFRNHLGIANQLEDWIRGMREQDFGQLSATEQITREGVYWGVRQAIAGLRLGDYLPGGALSCSE